MKPEIHPKYYPTARRDLLVWRHLAHGQHRAGDPHRRVQHLPPVLHGRAAHRGHGWPGRTLHEASWNAARPAPHDVSWSCAPAGRRTKPRAAPVRRGDNPEAAAAEVYGQVRTVELTHQVPCLATSEPCQGRGAPSLPC